MISREQLLEKLPVVQDQWELITQDQDVNDIIKQVIAAHAANRAAYDKIALCFDAGTVQQICDNIYDFEKANIRYREEPVTNQTTAIPGGILERGYGDCKHYASFAGGVLDGLKRLTGKKIDWNYRFVSYQLWKPVPYHVFVAVRQGNKEFWIDPTPGAIGKQPVWVIDRKPKIVMPLYNQVAGIDSASGSVGGFSDVFKFIQHNAAILGMQVPRGAFLGLVYVNAFGYANKLFKALQFPDTHAKLQDIWERFGGQFSKLVEAINHGVTQPVYDKYQPQGHVDSIPVSSLAAGTYKDAYGQTRYYSDNSLVPGQVSGGKIGDPAIITAAVISSAAIVVAAIMPIIGKMLDHHYANVETPGIQLDPVTGLPVGVPDTSNAVLNFVRSNPLVIGIAGLGLIYYLYE